MFCWKREYTNNTIKKVERRQPLYVNYYRRNKTSIHIRTDIHLRMSNLYLLRPMIEEIIQRVTNVRLRFNRDEEDKAKHNKDRQTNKRVF